jgi:hypothetical protein
MKEVMTNLNDLSRWQRRLLREVGSELERAVSPAEAKAVLEARGGGGPALSNPLLRPVAFSFRPPSPKLHLYAFECEALAWGVLFPACVLMGLAALAIPVLAGWEIYTGHIGIFSGAIVCGLLPALLNWLVVVEREFNRKRWAARRLRRKAYERLCAATHPPILYLRSFSFDSACELPPGMIGRVDEKLTEHCEQFGPVIAVAGPYDRDISPGPVRLHLDDEVWRAGIIYLMSVSRFVVIQAGISSGTLWELGVARERLNPERLIISVADAGDHHYHDFRPYAEAILGCEMPKDINPARQIRFGKGWTPVEE